MTRLSFLAPLLLSLPAAAEPPHEAVSRDRLLENLKMFPEKRSAMGDQEHKDGLGKTEELITARLRELGYEPTLHEFRWAVPARGWNEQDGEPDAAGENLPPWHNIIIELRGTELPHEVLLIGAHFDAVPNCPGADDNATGAAGLLELARVLKDHPTRRTIRLIFFNVEEAGMIGSTSYVKSLDKDDQDQAEHLIGMVSMEMLGYFSDEPGSQKSPIPPIKDVFEPPTVGDNICIAGIAKHQSFSRRLAAEMRAAAPDLKVTVADFMPVPIPDILRSDNRPFLMSGYPAVMLTDTSNFRNPNYHKPTDTIDTLDLTRYTLVIKALAGAAYNIAHIDPPPPAPDPKPAPDKKPE